MRYNRQSTRYRILSTMSSLLASLLAGVCLTAEQPKPDFPMDSMFKENLALASLGATATSDSELDREKGCTPKVIDGIVRHGQSLALVHRNSASALGRDQTPQTCTDRLGGSALCRSRRPSSGIPRTGTAGGAEAVASEMLPDIAASRSARLATARSSLC